MKGYNVRQQLGHFRLTITFSLSDFVSYFCQVLTAPHMKHGTQWAGRGQSSARMLPANLLSSSLNSLSLQSFPPPFPSLHPHHREKKCICTSTLWFFPLAAAPSPFSQSCFKRPASSLPCSDRKAGHLHRVRVGCQI